MKQRFCIEVREPDGSFSDKYAFAENLQEAWEIISKKVKTGQQITIGFDLLTVENLVEELRKTEEEVLAEEILRNIPVKTPGINLPTLLTLILTNRAEPLLAIDFLLAIEILKKENKIVQRGEKIFFFSEDKK